MDLNQVVLDMKDVLEWVVSKDIDYVASLDPGGCPIKADRGQIEQILLSLALHARDAMPLGGRFTLETTNVGISKVPREIDSSSEMLPHILVSVTAMAIDLNNEAHPCVFELCRTTTDPADPNSALAGVCQLVTLIGGRATVDCQPDSLHIYLPRGKSG
jgi:two-component system cell cycle sensor histidine kinase/response regulator CckA